MQPIQEEHRFLWFSRFFFLLAEVSYVHAVSGKLSNSPFFGRVRAHSDYMRDTLCQALTEHGRIDYKDPFRKTAMKSILKSESFFSNLPSPIAQVEQAILSRKERAIATKRTPFGRRESPILSLSSVHPDYPLSYSSVDCMNTTIHHKLLPLYGVFSCAPSFLMLWTSATYHFAMLRGVKQLEPTPPEVISELTARVYQGQVKKWLPLAPIVLPRWSCIEIRSSGSILAHEHFHRLSHLVLQCIRYRDLLESAGRDGHDAAKVFGDPVFYLSGVTMKLLKLLGEELGSFNIQTYDVAAEILADVAGMVLVGPAFSYSLSLQIFPYATLGFDRVFRRHPHHYFRIELQKELLRRFRLLNAYKRLGETSAGLLDYVGSEGDYKGDPLRALRAYKTLLGRPDVMSLLEKFATHIGSAIDKTAEVKGKKYLCSYTGIKEESSWEAKLDRLISGVASGDMTYGIKNGEYSPTDVLNAMWIGREREYERTKGAKLSTGLSLRWRMWLSSFEREVPPPVKME